MTNILISYFSATGTTARIVKELADSIHADTYEIKPEKPYSEKDLKYTNPLSRCVKEYISRKEVSLIGEKPDIPNYDVVIIAFPIWFLKQPNIINTFIRQNDFSGKRVSILATSNNVDIAKAESTLHSNYPALNWKDGIRANEKSIAELEEWAKSI